MGRRRRSSKPELASVGSCPGMRGSDHEAPVHGSQSVSVPSGAYHVYVAAEVLVHANCANYKHVPLYRFELSRPQDNLSDLEK